MENNQRVQARDGSGKLVLPDGAMVRDYQVRYLTSGGMSVVYVGTRGEREFILKEVPASSVKEVPALIQEKGLLERLHHPGIVKFEALFDHQDFFYLVLEFIQGRPLVWYQREGNRASVEQVLDWGVQLCEIFGYLHQQDPPVIYRDLKPENVILSDGQLRLIDFGIARVHKGDRSSDTELMGTVTTASPEHYGSGETDARSDIYTLGATLYDLLSGGRRASQMAFKFAPIRELNPDAPPALEEALATALAFKPEDRFQSMEEFGQALLHCQGKAPKPARRAPTQDGARKGPSKALIAVLLLILLVVGVGYKSGMGPGGPPVDPVEKITENNLDGDVFFTGKVNQHDVVTLGEDISLFAVTDTNAKAGEERAHTVAERLN
ncbi:MAG: serine/threonine protein kinase, partial [Candidatus Eremiobacteraeota bacterium]|nr:serine/threonine protein kinase [Candidatus Eremiobacteraeota bacterium]